MLSSSALPTRGGVSLPREMHHGVKPTGGCVHGGTMRALSQPFYSSYPPRSPLAQGRTAGSTSWSVVP